MATELTTFQLSLIALLFVLIVCSFILLMFWISRAYPKEQKKLDPRYRSGFLVVILFIAWTIPAIFGIMEQETYMKSLKWWAVLFVAAILFYAIVSYWANKSIPSWNLWTEYVLPDVRRFMDADPYIGVAYYPPFLFHMVVNSSSSGKMDLQQIGENGHS